MNNFYLGIYTFTIFIFGLVIGIILTKITISRNIDEYFQKRNPNLIEIKFSGENKDG